MKKKMNLKTSFKTLAVVMVIGLFAHQAMAQEIMTPFGVATRKAPARSNVAEARFLPFFDDFSHNGLYPDSTKWTDFNVLVNDGFPLCPPNRNGATLDVLDANGKVYSYAINKCILDRDNALDLLDEIRAQLPAEVAEAKRVVSAKQEIIRRTNEQAEKLLSLLTEENIPCTHEI